MSNVPNSSNDRDPIDPQTASAAAPPPPPPGYAAAYPAPDGGKKHGIGARLATGLISSLLIISLLLNVYLGAFFASSMAGPTESVYEAGDENERIVILPIKGMIDDTTAGFVRSSLKMLKDNPPRAIILRVDSPGGGVSASDRIWHELGEYRKKNPDVPVIASFGSVAASGGYYVSADTDFIFVEPTTITGSIGVIAQAFTVERLLDKVGVTPEVIASTQSTQKDTLSPMREWTEKDRTQLRIILDTAYDRFVEIVFNGRKDHLTKEEVIALATGAPYTAKEALENKLADGEGYLDAAIQKAKQLGGIRESIDPHVTIIAPSTGFGLGGILGAFDAPSAKSLSSDNVRRWVSEMSMPRIAYLFAP